MSLDNFIKTVESSLTDGNVVPAVMFEEYMSPVTGEIDHGYVSYKLKEKVTKGKLQQSLRAAGLPTSYIRVARQNEVSLEEFTAEYRFGKYLNTKEWIMHFSVHYNKFLTRKSLFNYLKTQETS